MKKIIITLLFFVLFLNACKSTNDGELLKNDTKEKAVTALEKTMDSVDKNVIFNLNNGGWVCEYNSGILYSNLSDGRIILYDGITEETVIENVFAHNLQVFDSKLYFTNEQNRICSINFDGSDYAEHFTEYSVSFLLIMNGFWVFSDLNNYIYAINKTESVPELISDQTAIWVNNYGEWLIFTELKQDCRLMAYNPTTQERVQLSDYAFFPSINGDYIFYQENLNGYVQRLNISDNTVEIVLREWVQNFGFVENHMFYFNSLGLSMLNMENMHVTEIHQVDYGDGSEDVIIVEIENYFICNNKLYYVEIIRKENTRTLYEYDYINNSKTQIYSWG
ncbi:MAG: DUF5050 domain-containing protein [Oscillospiraceae bacterium]|nr:DUF5050 domain-containing protein [Oscillospiraceae bacterium]